MFATLVKCRFEIKLAGVFEIRLKSWDRPSKYFKGDFLWHLAATTKAMTLIQVL